MRRMATRSNIGIQYENGSGKMVYCHWDGYIEHNGVILDKFCKTLLDVESLISKGDIRSLNGKNDKFEVEYFNSSPKPELENFTNTRDAISKMEEYLYLFRVSENKWYVSEGGDFMEPLDQEIKKTQKKEKE